MDPFREFNHALKRFIRFLDTAIPDHMQIRVMKTAYKTLKHINKRWPHKCFVETLESDHADKLRAKDEAFFTGNDFSIPLFNEFVQNMQEVWKRVDGGFKERVWDHLTELLDLSKACHIARTVRA